MRQHTCEDNCTLTHYLGSERADFSGALYFQYRGVVITRDAIEEGARWYAIENMAAEPTETYATIDDVRNAIDAARTAKLGVN